VRPRPVEVLPVMKLKLQDALTVLKRSGEEDCGKERKENTSIIVGERLR